MIDQRIVLGNRKDCSCEANAFKPEEVVQGFADLTRLSLEGTLAPSATNGEFVNLAVCREPNIERSPKGDSICSDSICSSVPETSMFESVEKFARFESSSLTARFSRGISAFAGIISNRLGITTKSSGQ